MATFWKRPRTDGSNGWHVLIRRVGMPTLRRTFDRKRDAEDWAAEIETQIAKGQASSVREAEQQRLEELIELFLKGPLLERPSNQIPQLRARLQWWAVALGSRPLSQVRPSEIAVCKERLLVEPVSSGRRKRAHRRRGKATVNRYLTALSLVYRWARDHLHLDVRNPVLEVARMTEPSGRERVLSAEELMGWLEAAQSDQHPAAYPLIVTLCATGARLGELLYLERSCLVLEPAGREHLMIRVGGVRGTTKNRMVRAVPLWWQPLAIEVLQEWSAGLEGEGVFDLPMSTAQKVVKRTAAAAGLANVTSHVIRHTVATQLAEAGFTESQLKAFFGWKTSAMAHRYVHAVPERMLNALPMELAGRFRLSR